MATHGDILASSLLAKRCPMLPAAAYHIGDTQVRNVGTIGGSLVHADPAADWPAVVLALDAELEVTGPSGRRTIAAKDFFVDILQTSLQPGEIGSRVRLGVPLAPQLVAQQKGAEMPGGEVRGRLHDHGRDGQAQLNH